jgi:hypothetical protein
VLIGRESSDDVLIVAAGEVDRKLSTGMNTFLK